MNSIGSRFFTFTIIGICMTLSQLESAVAATDCDRMHTDNRVPTVQELTDCLKVSSGTRGLRVLPEGTQEAIAPQPATVSLNVTFEFGSSALTYDAQKQLNILGEALNSPALFSEAFFIEGHTDSVGTAEYNQWLSEKRAIVVKQYLVDNAGIRANRLKAIGQGEKHLLDIDSPTSATNRRVQIVKMQSTQ